jgi:outer membrane protein
MKQGPFRCCSYVILLSTLVALAQTPPANPLTLNDCIQLAINAPSSVTTARQQALIARYGVTAARAGFFPAITFQNTYAYNSTRAGNQTFIAMNGPREYLSVGNADVAIDSSGRTRAEVAKARADLRTAQTNVQISQRDLRRLVTSAYYRLLLARKLVLVARDALAESQRFQDLTGKLFSAGEVAQADVVKASLDVAFQQQALNNAQLEARVANHDLAAFWTNDVNAPLTLAEDPLEAPPPPPAVAETGQPFLRRLEFDVFDSTRNGLLAEARRARADLLPQMHVTYQYGIDSFRLSFADRGYAFIGRIDIPVFDWFRARNNVRQFRLQADQVDADRAIAQRTFSRDYQDALARSEQSYQQLSLTEDQVKFSTESLRLARVRYQGGEGPAQDVVVAQTQLAQARANQYTAKANYFNARADLEVAAAR